MALKVIAYEGVETVDGRTIAPGALWWRDLPLPVFWFRDETFSRAANCVGLITRLERDRNSVVWAEVDVTGLDTRDWPEGFILSLDGDEAVIDFTGTESEPKWVYRSMRVAAGTLLAKEAWAWK